MVVKYQGKLTDSVTYMSGESFSLADAARIMRISSDSAMLKLYVLMREGKVMRCSGDRFKRAAGDVDWLRKSWRETSNEQLGMTRFYPWGVI
jgi:hypothetical protein